MTDTIFPIDSDIIDDIDSAFDLDAFNVDEAARSQVRAERRCSSQYDPGEDSSTTVLLNERRGRTEQGEYTSKLFAPTASTINKVVQKRRSLSCDAIERSQISPCDLVSHSTTFESITSTSKNAFAKSAIVKCFGAKTVISRVAKKTTLAKTPKCFGVKTKIFTGVRNQKKQILSHEQTEELKLQESKKCAKLEKEKIKRAYEKSLAESKLPINALKSEKQLTIPETPRCIKLYPKREIPEEPNAITASQLKKGDDVNSRGPTIPISPRFQTDARARVRGEAVTAEPFVTAAELVQKFSHNSRSNHVSKSACQALTQPKGPVLQSDRRSMQSSRIKPHSSSEVEEALMKEAAKRSFYRPVNKRILQKGGVIGVPKVQPKSTTQVQPFNLKTEQLASSRVVESKSSEADGVSPAATAVFRAKPMPDFSNSENKKVVRTVKAPTVAKSPRLRGKYRASSAPPCRQRPHHSIVEKSRRLAVVEEVKSSPLRLTNPLPFHLATTKRGVAYRKHLEEKIRLEQVREAASRVIKANPVPAFTKPLVKTIPSKPLTEFEEFNLQSSHRHTHSEAKFQELLKEEEENLKKAFHALPLPKTTYIPDFVAEIGTQTHRPTVPQPVILLTSSRASQRKEFNDELVQKQEEERKCKEQANLKKEHLENLNIRLLQRKPIQEGGYKFVAAKILTEDLYPCKKVKSIPLTNPKSPHFRTALRNRSLNPQHDAVSRSTDAVL